MYWHTLLLNRLRSHIVVQIHVEVLLLQLQQELKKVEAVIDTVVDTHHLGFNQAVERYSKIITLFNECKGQVCFVAVMICACL